MNELEMIDIQELEDNSNNDSSESIVSGESNEVMNGTSDDDVIVGTAESVTGTENNDSLTGDDSANELSGNGGSDFLQGAGGDDVLDGGGKNDTLEGGVGSDQLIGSEGDDKISGGDGNDTLEGGEGKNRLEGGNGSDTFVLTAEGSTDGIVDFEFGVDTIALPEGISFDDLNSSGNRLLLDDRALAFFEGFEASELTVDNFISLGNVTEVEEAVGEEAVGEEAVGEEAVSEEAVSEEAVGEEAVGEEAVGEEAVGEEAVGEEAVGEEAVGEEAVSEEAVGEEAVSEEAVGEEAVGEEAVSEEAVGEEAVGEEAVGEEAVGEEAVGEEAVGEEAVGEEAVGEEAVVGEPEIGDIATGGDIITGGDNVIPSTSSLSLRENNQGRATFFETSGVLGNSGLDPLTGSAAVGIAAINRLQFDGSEASGAFLQVSGPEQSAGADPIVVQVFDQLPDRDDGLDLSPEAFDQIADPIDGIVDIDFELISPGDDFRTPFGFTIGQGIVAEGVEGTNPSFAAVRFNNHRHPVESVELIGDDGNRTDFTRGSDNRFVLDDGFPINGAQDLEVTDIFGQEVILNDVNITGGADTSQITGEQFGIL